MSRASRPIQDQSGSAKSNLSARQEAILKLIVHEYVQSGRPIGSKSLTERYGVGYSPATVRNEMAELEDAGLVQHLHTSGGRAPTDQGYRYYVHHLMGDVELPAGDQIMIRHQFRQAEEHLDGWMELAATVLAEIAGNVSVVTAPRAAVSKLRHVELISLRPRMALLILVTDASAVKQVMVHFDDDIEQPKLSQLSDVLAERLRGMDAEDIAAEAVGADPLSALVIDQIAAALRSFHLADQTAIRHSGLENIVGLPELGEADLQQVLGLLRGGAFLSAMLPRIGRRPDVQVFIGDETLPDELRRFGVVLATYGVEDLVTGVLGVLGPTRMSYWRTISTVRYMSKLMSDLMADMHPRLES